MKMKNKQDMTIQELKESVNRLTLENVKLKNENTKLRFHLSTANNSLEMLLAQFEQQRDESVNLHSELMEAIDKVSSASPNISQLPDNQQLPISLIEMSTESDNEQPNGVELVDIESNEMSNVKSNVVITRPRHCLRRHLVRFIDDRLTSNGRQEVLSYTRMNRRKHGTKAFWCERCPFKTDSHVNMKLHLTHHRAYQPESRFKCDHCDYQANHQRYVTNHAIIHRRSNLDDHISQSDNFDSEDAGDDYQVEKMETIKISSFLKKHNIQV